MSQIVKFGKLTSIDPLKTLSISGNNILSAEISGVTTIDSDVIFSNEKTYQNVSPLFKYKYTDNVFHSLQEVCISAHDIQSLTNINNYIIAVTSMDCKNRDHGLFWWKNEKKPCKKRIIYLNSNKEEYLRKGIMNALNDNFSFLVNYFKIEGVSFNKQTKEILIGISRVGTSNSEYKLSAIVLTATIHCNDTEISITCPIQMKINIDISALCLPETNLKLADLCMDQEQKSLIIPLSYENKCDGGYLISVAWYNQINKFSTISSVIKSSYTCENLCFKQKPDGITKIGSNEYLIVFDHDKIIAESCKFDYCIVKL